MAVAVKSPKQESKSSIRRLSGRRRIWLAVATILAVFGVICFGFISARNAKKADIGQIYRLDTSRLESWKAYGGSWSVADGALKSNSNERGAKLVAGLASWSNYTLSADIRFDGVAADMGVTLRSNDESVGVDAYDGYFVGLRSLDGTLVIGRSNYAWVEARPVLIPGGVHPAEWYRLKVTAYGCNIAASAQNLTTGQTAWIAFEERSCVKSGRIGLRTLNANGMWRNVTVVQASWNDYLELQQHAEAVEQPVTLDGPPWWTPWHVGMLFVSALCLASLAQLVYFRVQQWKSLTIMQERDRLAHEIHDTMAQSFAGVGYQIQGIRRSVIRGGGPDSRAVADQLSVAYQLIRRCHEEASRTITMLNSSSPIGDRGLLDELAKTAHKIAGDQIEVVTNLRGNAPALHLRLADALLHIGQECIANAVSHSDLDRLEISLIYSIDHVELSIADDGHGFDCSPAAVGFGILGMQKRARDVAATLLIESAPGQGTKVSVRARVEKEGIQHHLLRKLRGTFIKRS